jgi:carbon monoxide dehydrogenase subunit G
VECSPSTTEVILSGQVRFLGKLGEFGEPLIRKRAEIMVAEFARNVAARFMPAAPALAPEAPAGAALKRSSVL